MTTQGALHEKFTGLPGPRWRTFLAGEGRLEPAGGSLRLVNEAATRRAYSDAQIDDYQGLPRRAFLWRPPLTLRVRARFSHPAARQPAGPSLLGTAGFGFWNDPFMMTGTRVPALPRAIWFFYASPPSDMPLDLHTLGWGWKAATIDAGRWPALLLAPTAPLAVPLFNVRALYRRLWPLVQSALHIREAPLPASMTEWHTYTLAWGRDSARFTVDGQDVLACAGPPRGPLGLVIWIDNQYLVARPWGRFAYGFLDVPERQWLELESVEIE